jgi:ribonuclease R
MQSHIGDEFDGRISGFAPFGIYVQIDEPFVSVLLPFEQLDDTYEPDDLGIRLIGARTSKLFTMNDPVTVRIEDANVQSRDVVGSLLAHQPAKAPTEVRRRQGRAPSRPSGGSKQRSSTSEPGKKHRSSKGRRGAQQERQEQPRKRPRRKRR